MTPQIEDRLREIALRLDHASERYTEAHVLPQEARRPSRRIIVFASGVVVLVALVVGGMAMTSRKPAPSLAPTTFDSSNGLTPTATVELTKPSEPSTSSEPTTTQVTRPTFDPTHPTFDPTHTPVSDSNGNQVGWIDRTNQADVIRIPLPESYTALDPLYPTAIGVIIVRDDNGKAIGLATGLGFIRGGLTDATHIDPAIEQQIIDNAIQQPPVYTTNPNPATTVQAP